MESAHKGRVNLNPPTNTAEGSTELPVPNLGMPEGFLHPSPFGPGATIGVACVGTAIAGGLFSLALLAIEIARTLLSQSAEFRSDDLFYAFPGFIIGFFYAGVVSLPVGLAGWLLAALIRIKGAPIWLASFVGGWTGFICTIPASNDFPVLLAVAMGQIGAALAASIGAQANRRALGLPATPMQVKIGLRQLFGVTTVICVIAAILGGLKLTTNTYWMLGNAAVLQAALVAAAAAVRKVRSLRRRNTTVA